MTTIYYAIGGGMGHARRARRVLEALAIDAEIVASDDVPRALEGDRDAHRQWLADRFRGHRVIVDTFPAGIQGELSGIDDVTFDHVARLLRWDDYRSAVPHAPPRFETTYVVEELMQEHEQFLRTNSDRLTTLQLIPPATGNGQRATPFTLIVHSGPTHELEELIAYAKELGDEPLLVATPCAVDGVDRIDTDSPADFFPAAARIVSAAGFNVMLETEAWRDKHHVVPFPRRFDDQFLRAARRRR
ncbi:MAG TPA: hypothetical protein VN181_00660 [Thermoanaerobaculia bacterium]|nr:hypothetical protein [Thermoanaerobaculia bacterium]